MKNKIIRELDKQNRLTIGVNLLTICDLAKGTPVAICAYDKNQIAIRRVDDLKGCKILCMSRLDNKARMTIPEEIRGHTHTFEMYVKDENLILEEAQ